MSTNITKRSGITVMEMYSRLEEMRFFMFLSTACKKSSNGVDYETSNQGKVLDSRGWIGIIRMSKPI